MTTNWPTTTPGRATYLASLTHGDLMNKLDRNETVSNQYGLSKKDLANLKTERRELVQELRRRTLAA